MKKRLMDKLLKEVGDIGDRMMLGTPMTVGGGVVNVGVATPSSPDDSQNPDEFDQNAFLDAGPDGYKNIEAQNIPPQSPELTYSPSIAGSASNINTKPQDAEPTQKPNVAIQPEDEVNVEKGIKDIKYGTFLR